MESPEVIQAFGSQEPLKNLLAYELSKKHVENHPFFCHLEHLGFNRTFRTQLLVGKFTYSLRSYLVAEFWTRQLSFELHIDKATV